MKILVTGGAGFLGKHLCRSLATEGHEVKVLDLVENPEFPTVFADVRDQAAMHKETVGADAIFHLAAKIEAGESVTNPLKYLDHNVLGTLTVLEAMKKNNVPIIIFSSSAAVYGEPNRSPIYEDDRTLPINPYGVSKLAMEGLVNSYVHTAGLSAVALRYFNLYGPEEHHIPETHAIPRFIKQIYKGEPVTVWGSGEHKRDFVFVTDIVSAHLKALEYAARQPSRYSYFNLSAEQPCAVIDLVHSIEALIDKSAVIKHHPSRPGDPLVLIANAAKAREELGWSAQVSLDDGLKQTVEYFLNRWNQDETV